MTVSGIFSVQKLVKLDRAQCFKVAPTKPNSLPWKKEQKYIGSDRPFVTGIEVAISRDSANRVLLLRPRRLFPGPVFEPSYHQAGKFNPYLLWYL